MVKVVKRTPEERAELCRPNDPATRDMYDYKLVCKIGNSLPFAGQNFINPEYQLMSFGMLEDLGILLNIDTPLQYLEKNKYREYLSQFNVIQIQHRDNNTRNVIHLVKGDDDIRFESADDFVRHTIKKTREKEGNFAPLQY